ncbi:nuclear pore protein 84/107 [Entophlyctis helioformis]|nr:nuclear pore protein 84/107 [Entophlyctis helioformis]
MYRTPGRAGTGTGTGTSAAGSPSKRRTRYLAEEPQAAEHIQHIQNTYIEDAGDRLHALSGHDFETFAQLFGEADPESLLDHESSVLVKCQEYCLTMADKNDGNDRYWIQEANTWSLVLELLIARQSAQDQMVGADEDDVEVPVGSRPNRNIFQSDRYIANKVLNGKDAQEHSVVKQWLERTAPDFNRVQVHKGYYHDTLAQIRNKKRLEGTNMGSVSNDQIVTELDPDAPTRQNRQLAPHDQNYEAQMFRTMYEDVRRGRLLDAVALCQDCDQPWRAATLLGGITREDKFVDGVVNEDNELITGNENVMLWKATCYQIAMDERADPYERALYAVLAGDVKNALPACQTWEDHVWLRYNALEDSLVRKALGKHSQTFPALQELSLPLPHFDLEASGIFDLLIQSEDPKIKAEAAEPFHIIQAHTIVNMFQVMFDNLASHLTAIRTNANAPDIPGLPQVLRFVTHLILFLRLVEEPAASESANQILCEYIDLLALAGKYDLVPMYVQYLPADQQVESYSDVLARLDGVDQARMAEYVGTGRDYSLDMPGICLATVHRLFSAGGLLDARFDEVPAVTLSGARDPVPMADEVQIHALGWLAVDESQAFDLFEHVNLLLRHFLILGHLNSATRVIEEYQGVFADKRIMDYVVSCSDLRGKSLAQEFSADRGFIEAFVNYTEWTKVFFMGRPASEKPHEVQNWLIKAKSYADRAIDNLSKLLEGNGFSHVPDGGLVHETHIAYQRGLELDIIGNIYLPEIILWLHQIYYEMHPHVPTYLDKSLELAIRVAGVEESSLYAEFKRSGKLGVFLRAIRKSALAQLALGKTLLSKP